VNVLKRAFLLPPDGLLSAIITLLNMVLAGPGVLLSLPALRRAVAILFAVGVPRCIWMRAYLAATLLNVVRVFNHLLL